MREGERERQTFKGKGELYNMPQYPTIPPKSPRSGVTFHFISPLWIRKSIMFCELRTIKFLLSGTKMLWRPSGLVFLLNVIVLISIYGPSRGCQILDQGCFIGVGSPQVPITCLCLLSLSWVDTTGSIFYDDPILGLVWNWPSPKLLSLNLTKSQITQKKH